MVSETDIERAKRALDIARVTGDQLRIDLAQAALNETLERFKEQRDNCNSCHT